MSRWVFAGLIVALGLAGAAVAQSVRPPLPTRVPAAPPAATAQTSGSGVAANLPPDPARLQSDLRALERRVGALETTLTAMRSDMSRASFSCASPTRSQNGAGVSEDCSPYACNAVDGRCRTVAVNSAQCAPGFSWCALNNHCTTAAECSSG